MIEISNIKKTYDKSDRYVLDCVSFTLKDGDFAVVTGKSGSGKSTLIHCLAGLINVTEGEIFYDGDALSAMSATARCTFRNKTIGCVFQKFLFEPNLSVYENIELPLLIAGKKTIESAWKN